jgi:hypothetical protein
MTLYGLIAAIVWAALAAFFIVKLDAFGKLVLERTKPHVVDATSIEIPEDLMALASQETEKWASDATIEAIRERYAQYGHDWNRVRKAFGLGAMS